MIVGNRLINSEYTVATILRLDSLGNQVWWKNIGYQGDEKLLYLHDVLMKEDGTYLASGTKYLNPIIGGDYQHYWLINFDDTGQIIWSKYYGNNDWAGWGRIARCADGNYAMCGWEKDQPIGPYKQYGVISKVTPDGDLLWHRKYTMSTENKRYDVFYGFTPTSDGGFVCVGTVWGDSSTRENAWIVKLDSVGCLEPGCDRLVGVVELPVGKATPINIYPNPAGGFFTVEAREAQRIEHIRVYDVQGRTVTEKSVPRLESAPIDLGAAAPGSYFCAVLVGGVWVVRQVNIR